MGRGVGRLLQRGVEHRLVRDDPGGLDAAGGGDDDDRARVVDPGRELGGGEAAEHDGVHRPEARAGEHRDRGERDHRQVDDDPVALAHPEAAQHAREAGHLVEQLGVGQRRHGPGHRGVVDDRGLVAPAVAHVPVHRVVAGVEHPAGEPPVQRGGVRVEDPHGLRVPLHERGRLAPEAVRVGHAAGVGLGPRAGGGAAQGRGAVRAVRLVVEHAVMVAPAPPPGEGRPRAGRAPRSLDGRSVAGPGSAA